MEPMSEQAGPSIAAIQVRQAALARQHGAAAATDRLLVEALDSAHAVLRESVRRLDTIATEIDRTALSQAEAVDNPMRAREFQKFLIAKQREIAAVVAEAYELGRRKSAVLQSLREKYLGRND